MILWVVVGELAREWHGPEVGRTWVESAYLDERLAIQRRDALEVWLLEHGFQWAGGYRDTTREVIMAASEGVYRLRTRASEETLTPPDPRWGQLVSRLCGYADHLYTQSGTPRTRYRVDSLILKATIEEIRDALIAYDARGARPSTTA